MAYSDPSYENILMFKGRKLGILRIFLNRYHEFFSQKPWLTVPWKWNILMVNVQRPRVYVYYIPWIMTSRAWQFCYSIVVDPNKCIGLAVKHCTGSLPSPLPMRLTWGCELLVKSGPLQCIQKKKTNKMEAPRFCTLSYECFIWPTWWLSVTWVETRIYK
jgi:hypothetical protein